MQDDKNHSLASINPIKVPDVVLHRAVGERSLDSKVAQERSPHCWLTAVDQPLYSSRRVLRVILCTARSTVR
jgi:hypothetical protein